MRKYLVLLGIVLPWFHTIVFCQYTLADDDVVVNDGVIVSCNYDFSDTEIIIPDVLDGQTVIGILGHNYYEENGFSPSYVKPGVFGEKGITKVTLPNTLERIGEYAFWANSISELVIPESLKIIAPSAFIYNEITILNVPKNVEYIGRNAFCFNELISVTFEDNSQIKTIGLRAFFENSGLKGFLLPTNSISGYTHYEDFQGNIYYAGDSAKNLEEVFFADLSIHTLTLDDIVFKNNSIYDYYGGYSKIEIPASFDGEPVYSIMRSAFERESLTEVVLPESLSSIEMNGFHDNLLKKIDLPSNIFLGPYVFGYNRIDSLVLPDDAHLMGDGVFQNNRIKSIYIPPSLYSLPALAFANNQLSEIDLPEGILRIGASAFINNNLKYVKLPNTVNKIGERAFLDNDPSLTSIMLPLTLEIEGYNLIDWINLPDSSIVFFMEDLSKGYVALLEKTLHVENKNTGLIKLFPNPATSHLCIEGIKDACEIRIYDVLGKEKINQKVDSYNNIIYINELKHGNYFIVFDSGVCYHFIKQ